MSGSRAGGGAMKPNPDALTPIRLGVVRVFETLAVRAIIAIEVFEVQMHRAQLKKCHAWLTCQPVAVSLLVVTAAAAEAPATAGVAAQSRRLTPWTEPKERPIPPL